MSVGLIGLQALGTKPIEWAVRLAGIKYMQCAALPRSATQARAAPPTERAGHRPSAGVAQGSVTSTVSPLVRAN